MVSMSRWFVKRLEANRLQSFYEIRSKTKTIHCAQTAKKMATHCGAYLFRFKTKVVQ
jgi:hypothetical protein